MQIDCLQGMKDSGAEELESSSSIHGALNHLKLADLPLNRAGGPRCRERVLDCAEIAPEACGEFCNRCSHADVKQTVDACLRLFAQKQVHRLDPLRSRRKRGFRGEEPGDEPDVLIVSEIGAIIADHMGISCRLIGMQSSLADWTVGESPWATALPFVASDVAARTVGYAPVETYRQALPAMCDWLMQQADKGDSRERFPVMAGYPWNPFDYDAEDGYLGIRGLLHES